MATSKDALTTITVHASILRAARSVKPTSKTWDDVLLDWLEGQIPKEYWLELARSGAKRPTVAAVGAHKLLQA
ncbi:MAG: hypothetical protein KGI89_17465 [Euryarchaeota archaeon]|nr:hypothetical protein [Euryarchaeota archaeon]